MLLAEQFVSSLVKKIHGHQHSASTDEEVLGIHPQACRFLRLHHHHHMHSSYEKSIIIERTMQYMIKDRTECFDDYFPCRKKNCKLLRVWGNKHDHSTERTIR